MVLILSYLLWIYLLNYDGLHYKCEKKKYHFTITYSKI